MNYTQIIGIVGATLILIAFVMEQTHRWKDTDLIYDFFNSVGGVCMLSYAWLLQSYPFFILNLVWSIVSIRDLYNDVTLIRKNRPTSHK